MLQRLLIEIGVEELPALPLLKELSHIQRSWAQILENSSLLCDFKFYYTPRRLVLWHSEFKSLQDDSVEEMFGAPLSIAFKDGKPTAAALGFAKKCGVDIDEISKIQKGNKEVLYYKKVIKGQESKLLLESMLQEWLNSLNFGKSMRWGNNTQSFIRPIRWVNIMMQDRAIELELFGVKSAPSTLIHRSLSSEPIEIKSSKEYFKTLRDGGVVLDQEERKEMILTGFKKLEVDGFKIDVDTDLLEEIVAITESPTPLVGRFDEKFLALPPEVVVTSMKEHQRYFALYKETALANRFVVVSNAQCDDFSKVIEGNERVLRPRLEDALFFYNNDLSHNLSTDGLERVQFLDKLGSLKDKVEREKSVTEYLFDKYGKQFGLDKQKLLRAQELCKADLLSEMVYEFTELQGLMGSYYALEQGEDEMVVLALKEQYLPEGDNSPLPSTPFSAVVALSIKLETLLSLFSIDRIPTGSKDPFALRRAVNGVVRISLKYNLNFNIIDDLKNLAKPYNTIDLAKLESFFLERLSKHYSVNPSIVNAVISSKERDILQIDAKIKAVAALANSCDFDSLFSTFKRVANITKDIDLQNELVVNKELLKESAEIDLATAFNRCMATNYNDIESELDALFALKPELDHFFDTVMVNSDDLALQGNRKALIGSIYKAILNIADIKEITLQ